jgi:hypothetical protein
MIVMPSFEVHVAIPTPHGFGCGGASNLLFHVFDSTPKLLGPFVWASLNNIPDLKKNLQPLNCSFILANLLECWTIHLPCDMHMSS